MPTVHNILRELYSGSDISYLELGLGTGENFACVQLESKVSVDNGSSPFSTGNPTYLMDTDDFFLHYKNKFDIVFIDGDHKYSQVIKDFNNSIKHLKKGGQIFIHDLYPPDLWHTNSENCDDGFKFLNYLLDSKQKIIVDLADTGLTCIFNPSHVRHQDVEQITYDSFTEKYPPIHGKIFFDTPSFIKQYKKIKTIFNPTEKAAL